MTRLRLTTLALALAAAPLAAQSTTRYSAPHQQLAREIYRELIEINTGTKTGTTAPAVEAMARRLRDAGIPAADLFVGGPVPEKQNLVARLRGRGQGRPVLLLAHVDVVEALKADWSPDLDPFRFIEKDGYFYGRGTADDKAMAAIFVANLIRMKREGIVPDRDIIVALTADEEADGDEDNGVHWLLEKHPALVDAAFVINEGGGGSLKDGKPFIQSIQATEKVYTDFTLRVTNRGGHSSVPRPDNAIYALAAGLDRLSRFSFPVQLNDVTREYFRRTADIETPEMAAAMRAIAANPADANAAATLSRDPRYNSMLRTTCVATMLKGGHATNALPQLAEANVNCRIFPGMRAAEVKAALERAVADTSIQVIPLADRTSPPAVGVLPELLGPVERITAELFPTAKVIPTMSTGATDSRFFRQRGVPAFGVSGLFSDPLVDARAHGRDERMRVQSFFEGQEFLWRLTRAITSAKPTM